MSDITLNYNQQELQELLKNIDKLENLADPEKRKLIKLLIEDIYKLENHIQSLQKLNNETNTPKS